MKKLMLLLLCTMSIPVNTYTIETPESSKELSEAQVLAKAEEEILRLAKSGALLESIERAITKIKKPIKEMLTGFKKADPNIVEEIRGLNMIPIIQESRELFLQKKHINLIVNTLPNSSQSDSHTIATQLILIMVIMGLDAREFGCCGIAEDKAIQEILAPYHEVGNKYYNPQHVPRKRPRSVDLKRPAATCLQKCGYIVSFELLALSKIIFHLLETIETGDHPTYIPQIKERLRIKINNDPMLKQQFTQALERILVQLSTLSQTILTELIEEKN